MNMSEAVVIVAFFIFMFAMSFDSCAEDGEWYIGATAASYHWDSKEEYNEVNPGVILEYHREDDRFGFMNFENSYNNNTSLIYWGTDYYESQYLDLGINMGLQNGYDNLPVFIIPTATVKLSSNNPLVPNLNIYGVPGVVLGFGLGWTW